MLPMEKMKASLLRRRTHGKGVGKSDVKTKDLRISEMSCQQPVTVSGERSTVLDSFDDLLCFT
jgi:hypothetical protein